MTTTKTLQLGLFLTLFGCGGPAFESAPEFRPGDAESGSSGAPSQIASGGAPNEVRSSGGAPQTTAGANSAWGGNSSSTTGGSSSLAGATGTTTLGGSGGSTFGGSTSGGATSGGGSSLGGSTSSGGSSSGGASSGGAPLIGSGGAPICKDYVLGEIDQIGTIVRKGTKTYECVEACNFQVPGNAPSIWASIACDATCGSCAFDCSTTPRYGKIATSQGAIDDGRFQDYRAAIKTGWRVATELADGCSKNGQCAFVASYTLLECDGATEDCRAFPPEFEFCSLSSAIGNFAPCRDVASRPTSPWTVVASCH